MTQADYLIPRIRAALARRLVEKHGLKRSQAARALGLTPQAVTQYLSGARAGERGEFVGNPQVVGILDDVASRIATRGTSMLQAEVLDLAFEVASILQSKQVRVETASLMLTADAREKVLKTLRARLQVEQQAAEIFMGAAVRTRNDLTRLLFRQIASDSIRHADIIMSTISAIERGEAEPADLPAEPELKRLLREEEEADRYSLDDIKGLVQDRIVGLLIESIEADEAKHSKLLQRLLELRMKG